MVYSAFEDNEVSFLPVKGILIKKLYPVENYRSSVTLIIPLLKIVTLKSPVKSLKA